jgi:STE24 endopeptidase
LTTFDPAAATAAYLAQLPPETHARATAYTQGGHWLLLWGAVVSVLVGWIVLRSGVLVKIRNGVERHRSRPWLAVLAVLAVDGVAEAALAFPWTAYDDWWRERAYGLTSRDFGGWAGEWALMAAISLVISLILMSLIYALIRRAPRTWWIWSGGLTGLFMILIIVLAPVYIMPLINSYEPAPPGPVRDAVVAMANANGVPSDKIFVYDGSKQSNRYTANVAGLGGTARIAMSDVMFKKGADLAEVRGVVGHEMGHYAHQHAIWIAGAFGLLALAGFFLVDRLFPLVLRLTGAKGVTGLSDPAGAPVIAILIAVMGLLATPLQTSITRITEADADRYSLEHVGEPDGLSRALVKTIEYRAATPSRLEEVLFYDHPSVGSRIRRAMDWKAAHPRPGT